MRVAVLGGYGNFGARICRALAADPSIELLVGGRDAERAVALVGHLPGQAQAIELDAASETLADALRAAAVELLIHTAGPFQGQDYRVARAAAQAGAHYIDLADGRRFVADFSVALDETFRAAGRRAVSGASTVPALSSAVVDRYRGRFTRLDEIAMCIAPPQRAPRGGATLAAVLSYCGEPIDVWIDGAWQRRVGWADLQPMRFERLPARTSSSSHRAIRVCAA
jgi:saccharopine dehydrogenase-like NADP-dependent oxidoreductase